MFRPSKYRSETALETVFHSPSTSSSRTCCGSRATIVGSSSGTFMNWNRPIPPCTDSTLTITATPCNNIHLTFLFLGRFVSPSVSSSSPSPRDRGLKPPTIELSTYLYLAQSHTDPALLAFTRDSAFPSTTDRLYSIARCRASVWNTIGGFRAQIIDDKQDLPAARMLRLRELDRDSVSLSGDSAASLSGRSKYFRRCAASV